MGKERLEFQSENSVWVKGVYGLRQRSKGLGYQEFETTYNLSGPFKNFEVYGPSVGAD